MKIELFTNPDKKIEKEYEVHNLNFQHRMLRALKISGIFFVGAVICAPIPVVHLTIPFWLILSVSTGIWKLRQKIEVNAPDLKCPECGAPQALVCSLVKWPHRGYCSECRSQFIVRPKA